MDGRLYLAQCMEMLIKWHSHRNAVSGIGSMALDGLQCIDLYGKDDQFHSDFHFSSMYFRSPDLLYVCPGTERKNTTYSTNVHFMY